MDTAKINITTSAVDLELGMRHASQLINTKSKINSTTTKIAMEIVRSGVIALLPFCA
jgi:hypothetical protein